MEGNALHGKLGRDPTLRTWSATPSLRALIGRECAATMIISGDDPVSKGAQRFEVFTGAGKRRDWPPEIKASIVAECYSGREGVGAVARLHGLDPSQVYAWRRDFRDRLEAEGVSLPSAGPQGAGFVPAVIDLGAPPDPAPVHRAR